MAHCREYRCNTYFPMFFLLQTALSPLTSGNASLWDTRATHVPLLYSPWDLEVTAKCLGMCLSRLYFFPRVGHLGNLQDREPTLLHCLLTGLGLCRHGGLWQGASLPCVAQTLPAKTVRHVKGWAAPNRTLPCHRLPVTLCSLTQCIRTHSPH